MKKILPKIVLIIFILLVAFPLFYMLSLSLFPTSDFFLPKARFFPSKLNWQNYIRALKIKDLFYYLANSIGTSLLTMLVRISFIILAAFSFTHLNFKGKKVLLLLLVLTLFIPFDTVLYQNYETIVSLHLTNTWLGITLPLFFSASQLLFLIASFSFISKDYYDSSQLDGASDFTYIYHVLIPLSLSVIITLSLQTFITTFNSYLWPLLVTDKPKARTIQVTLTFLGFSEEGDYGAEAASIALTVIPFIIVLAFSRKIIVKALSEGLSS